MSTGQKIHIVGIGDDGLRGLPAWLQRVVEQADVLAGDERTLALVSGTQAERLTIGGNLDEAVRSLRALSHKRIVLLASGDPLFYGLTRYLSEKLGKDRFHVEPHVSSMQLAFARVMESWEEAYLTNLANRPLNEVLERVRTVEKAGLFTTEASPPSRVARALLEQGIDYFSAYVCENLGSPDERVTQGTLEEIASLQFAPLNVLILVRQSGAADQPQRSDSFRLFGNPEDAFVQSTPKHGLMTPAEVRSMALAEMGLTATSTVWDVGAGCGAVGIEAARIANRGHAYAIEMDAEDHELIQENARRLRVPNVTAVLGRAPQAWANLPDPDAVFVEGSGREVCRILEMAFERLRQGGRIVANVGSLDNLAEGHQALSLRTDRVKVWMVNLARGTQQLGRIRFEALNPTFLLSAEKTPVESAP